MDKFKALETFIAVAEAGSFSGASRKLNISAPSVTRIISDLEAELGTHGHPAYHGASHVWAHLHHAYYHGVFGALP